MFNLVQLRNSLRPRHVLILFLFMVAVLGFYHASKSMPAGLDTRSELYPIAADDVQFIADRTSHSDDSDSQYDHVIFNIMIDLIENADELLVMDMFLFNSDSGQLEETRRPLVAELTEAIVTSQDTAPERTTSIITDLINTGYGSYTPEHLAQLEASGATVTITDLDALPDSNPLYSAWYRAGLRFLPPVGGSFLPNVFESDGPGMDLRAYGRLLNFKANHRKVLVTATNDTAHALISSMNVHDASSAHSNSGVVVRDHPIINDILASERAVVNFSDSEAAVPHIEELGDIPSSDTSLAIQLLTEQAIKDAVLHQIDSLEDGDRLDMAMFYISDRDIVNALQEADTRGATLRLLLDPNQDAFGREKNGIPNRQVAHELMQHTDGNTTVRWCHTEGEQCHSKFILTESREAVELIIGSANLTRRNITNRNLETNLRLVGAGEEAVLRDAADFFHEQWENRDGRRFSTEYDTFADPSRIRTIWYHVGEFTGMSHY